MYPEDRKYSKEHEWIAVEGDTGTVGITEFAQDQLGDIVFVELPEAGARVARQDVLGTIESVKAVSEIYCPISGEVVEVNAELEQQPELVNSEPHAGGWYCKIKIRDTAELEDLMDAAAYQALVDSQ